MGRAEGERAAKKGGGFWPPLEGLTPGCRAQSSYITLPKSSTSEGWVLGMG